MWVDVGKLIREHVPDKGGNTLPSDLTSGSYQFRDLFNKAMGTLFEGKVIYDKTFGHVAYGCAICCGYTTTQLWFNPLGVPLGSATPDGVYAFAACDGQFENVSDSFYTNWSSANTAIATVDTYGTHTGLSVGSSTSQTIGYLPGTNQHAFCPLLQKTPIAPDNTNPIAQISSVALSPSTINLHTSPTASTITVQIFHTDMAAVGSQTVQVTVGTYSSDPAPPTLAVAYNPATFTVTLSGAQGVSTGILGVSSQAGSGTVLIQATLSNPSTKVSIVAPSPASNAQKTLTVTAN